MVRRSAGNPTDASLRATLACGSGHRNGRGAAIGSASSPLQGRDAGWAPALPTGPADAARAEPRFPPAPVRHRPPQPRGPRPSRPRIALTAVLLAAAMPVRISDTFPIVNSVSILDILLLAAAATLFLDLAFRPIDPGHRRLFRILCVPLVHSLPSLVCSQDRAATVCSTIIYAEG